MTEGEKPIVIYRENGKVTHIISTTKMRDCYYLYKVKDGKEIKTKYKSADPTELEKYVYKGKENET